jgi:hypothetical protein
MMSSTPIATILLFKCTRAPNLNPVIFPHPPAPAPRPHPPSTTCPPPRWPSTACPPPRTPSTEPPPHLCWCLTPPPCRRLTPPTRRWHLAPTPRRRRRDHAPPSSPPPPPGPRLPDLFYLQQFGKPSPSIFPSPSVIMLTSLLIRLNVYKSLGY